MNPIIDMVQMVADVFAAVTIGAWLYRYVRSWREK
jgi:hypothetical protein